MITIHYPASVKECWAHLGVGYYLPEMDEIPTLRKLPALSKAWRPRSWGVNMFFLCNHSSVRPMCVCIYIIIYTVYDIYKRSMEVFSGLHSGGFFLTENRTGSLPELLTNRHASFIMACCWAPVVISRVDLTGFFIKWTPKPPHTIHTEPAPFSCRFRDHGKVNQNSRFTPVFHPPGPQIPPPSWRALLALRPTHHNRNQRTTAAPSPRERGRVGSAWEKRLSCFLLKRSPFSKTCTSLQHPTTSRPKVSKNFHVKIFCTSKIHTLCSFLSHGKKSPQKTDSLRLLHWCHHHLRIHF